MVTVRLVSLKVGVGRAIFSLLRVSQLPRPLLIGYKVLSDVEKKTNGSLLVLLNWVWVFCSEAKVSPSLHFDFYVTLLHTKTMQRTWLRGRQVPPRGSGSLGLVWGPAICRFMGSLGDHGTSGLSVLL